MPFFTPPSESTASFYYQFSPSDFDPSKPTVLVLHPLYTDTSVSQQRFLDKVNVFLGAGNGRMNRLSIDLRGHGRSTSDPLASIDHWTHAADIALILEHLSISSIHIVTTSLLGPPIAFTFATLFPPNTLSISCLGGAPLYTPHGNLAGFQEVCAAWMQDEDIDMFYEALDETLWWAVGDGVAEEERDWLAGMILRRYSPFKALRSFEATIPTLLPTGLTVEDIQKVECPVFLLAGGDDQTCPVEVVEEIYSNLTSSRTAQMHIVEGAPSFLAFTNSDEVLPIVLKFLYSHAFPLPSPPPPPISLHSALSILASLSPPSDRETILSRDPLDARSFSRAPTEGPWAEARKASWELCKRLDGHAFETMASRDKETWEVGGRLEDERDGWLFSRRNDYDLQSRRPSAASFSSLWDSLSDPTIEVATTTTIAFDNRSCASSCGGSSRGGMFPPLEKGGLSRRSSLTGSLSGSVRESPFLRKAREERERMAVAEAEKV